MNKKIFVCEDTIEGIFTAVYDAYSAVIKHEFSHNDVEIIAGEITSFQLFADYIDVITNKEKASKVTKSICEKMGYCTYESLYFASTVDDDDKATDIYFTIVEGFNLKDSFKILDLWTNQHVSNVLALKRKASNEFCRWREFLQFRELENGILYSKIGPICNILPLLSSHFENRIPKENFIIHDEIRDLFLVHEASHKCVLVNGNSFIENREILEQTSDNDKIICALFKEFVETIAIKERINPKLQQQLMPLRIQKYKIEF